MQKRKTPSRKRLGFKFCSLPGQTWEHVKHSSESSIISNSRGEKRQEFHQSFWKKEIKMLNKNVLHPPNNINCTNLSNRNDHAITSLSTLLMSEKNLRVVSCCYWRRIKTWQEWDMWVTNSSLTSQASEVPGSAWQWKVPTETERLTPGRGIPTESEQLAVVNIYRPVLQWWEGSKKVEEIWARCLWIKPALTYVIWSFSLISIWSIKSYHLCLTATYL